MLRHRKLKSPSERVKITLSAPTYTNNDDGRLVLKNSARMRVMIDKTLLQEQGFLCDRLELVKFDEIKMYAVFNVSDKGTKVSTMGSNDKPKLEMSIPLSKLNHLNFNDFPPVKRAPCAFQFVDERMIILLPLTNVG